jgi:flagellar capping protein FliD
VEGVIPGVTLHLVSITNEAGADPAPITIDVSGDRAGVRAAIEDFIAAYNSAISEVRSAVVDSFRGDPIVTGLPSLMMQRISRKVSGLGEEAPSTLLELGVTFDADGTIELSNVNRLNEAIDQHGIQKIAAVFNAGSDEIDGQGIARRLDDLLDVFMSAPRDIGGYEIAGPLNLIDSQLKSRTEFLDTRIEREEERLERYEYSLRERYARLQDLISGIAAQSSISDSIFASYYSSQAG